MKIDVPFAGQVFCRVLVAASAIYTSVVHTSGIWIFIVFVFHFWLFICTHSVYDNFWYYYGLRHRLGSRINFCEFTSRTTTSKLLILWKLRLDFAKLFVSVTKKILANNNWIIRLLQFFESGDEILWCYHSNETSFANRLHGRIYFMILRHETWHFLWLCLLCHHYECTLVKEVKPLKHLSPFLFCH